MSPLLKKITTSFVLTSFLVLVFFGVFTMMHESDGQMQGDCPFSPAETSNCLQDTITAVFHYISSYQSFINVTVYSGMTAVLISLLASVILLFIMGQNIFKPLTLIKSRFYEPPSVSPTTNKITHWLSLFENSPSTYINT